MSKTSATSLEAPSDSVDYVFTDPPFGSNLFYADCSFLWEAWLGELTNQLQEAVWNKSRKPEQGGKSLDEYRELMEQSFAEMFRVLKPGRWATVVFSNSDDRVWEAIQTAAAKAGFVTAEAGTLDKIQRSFKGTKGDAGEETVVTKDVVMNLLKPAGFTATPAMERLDDPEAYIRAKLHAYLTSLADQESPDPRARTTQAIADHIITSLFTDGKSAAGISRAVVQAVAIDGFKQIDGLWYRRGDRVRSDRPGLGLNISDETSAVLWLEQRLALGTATDAELIPEFNKASAGARLGKGLHVLLQENFVPDAMTRRWRLPTALEREALNDSASDLRRRRVRQAVSGPSDGATSVSSLQLAEEAVRLEMYEEAGVLLARIHLPDLMPADLERTAALKAVVAAFKGK